MTSLEGRTALVTGGGRGLGAAVAGVLAGQGAQVALTYGSSATAAEQVAADIVQRGGLARAYPLPLNRADDVERALSRIVEDLPELDVVVHCAGVAAAGRIDALRLQDVRESLEVNLLSPISITKALLPLLRCRRRADVVFISSVATTNLRSGGAAYSLSKSALEAFAMTLAKEELAHGLHVNVVAPGLIDTDMGRTLLGQVAAGVPLDEVARASPFGHVCTPEEVANVVAFLVSPAASYVTGVRLPVDGARPVDWRTSLRAPGVPADEGSQELDRDEVPTDEGKRA